MYYTYMLRCEDNSIYTGYTDDLNKRMKSHFSDERIHAKYTKSHKPIKLEIAWQTKEKSNACKLEYYIKTLTKKQKEEIISGNKLSSYIKGKMDLRSYRRVNLDEKVNIEFK